MIHSLKTLSDSYRDRTKRKHHPFDRNPFHSDRSRRFRMRRSRFKDKTINLIHLLPNVLTSLNIACGVGAILFAINKQFETAGMLILIAAFFDLIDGKVARLVGAASPFGVQLDSLADLVSFGVAPPLIVHTMMYSNMSRLGSSLVLIYALCCALRLARYNIQAMGNQKKRRFFTGLPCPAPACLLASIVLASTEYGIVLSEPSARIILHIVMVCLSGLMVSTIPYPDLGSLRLEKKHVYQYNVLIVLILCVAVLRFKAVLLLLICTFVLGGPIHALIAFFQKKPLVEEFSEKTIPLPLVDKETDENGKKVV